jgi:PAS domain S-box-containing protein
MSSSSPPGADTGSHAPPERVAYSGDELETALSALREQNRRLQARVDELEFAEEERQRAVDELRKRDAELRIITDSVPVLISYIDRNHHYRFVNRAYELWFGRQTSEVQGKHMRDLLGAPAYEMVRPYLDEALRGRRVSYEMELPYAEGGARYINATYEPQLGEAGEVEGIVSMVADLSVQKRMADAQQALYRELREAERRVAFLAEASAVLSSSLDYEATVRNVARLIVPNLADWCSIHLLEDDGSLRELALTFADPEKGRWAESVPKRPFHMEAPKGIPRVLRTGEPELYPEVDDAALVEVARDEEELAVLRQAAIKSAVIVPLSMSGRARGTLTLLMSESGRRYAEPDLRLAEDLARRVALAVDNARLYKEAQEADKRKDEFLAMLAHELRNPLAPIRSAVRVLREHAKDDARVARQSDMIDRQATHMARLLDDLLETARITRGKIELRKEATDVRDVARRSVDALRATLEERGLDIAIELDHNPVVIEADPARVEQILVNLLSNAAKYTEPGGRVAVSVAAEATHPGAVIRVRDTGIGLAKDMWSRVFEPFVQADRPLDRSQGGLGIGLTLVKKLCELHGGSVSIHSEGVGRGTEVTVHLPASSEDRASRPSYPEALEATDKEKEGAARAAARAEATLPAKESQRVLVVDDNVDSAESLSELLSLWGYSVNVAHDGPSGIRMALTERPDVVLLDIGLPVIDGYEVARRLRQEAALSGVRIAALTGYGQAADRRRSKEAGFDEHLVKPVDPDKLRALLQTGSTAQAAAPARG